MDSFWLFLLHSFAFMSPTLCRRSHSHDSFRNIIEFIFVSFVSAFFIKIAPIIFFLFNFRTTRKIGFSHTKFRNIFFRNFSIGFSRQRNMRYNFYTLNADVCCHKHNSQTTFNDNTFQTGLVGSKRRYNFFPLFCLCPIQLRLHSARIRINKRC